MLLVFKSHFKLRDLDVILMTRYQMFISNHGLHFSDTTPSFVCRHPSSVNRLLASLAAQKQTWACWADCAFLCGDCSSLIFCLSFLNILSRRRSYRLDRRRLQSVGEISAATVQHPVVQGFLASLCYSAGDETLCACAANVEENWYVRVKEPFRAKLPTTPPVGNRKKFIISFNFTCRPLQTE